MINIVAAFLFWMTLSCTRFADTEVHRLTVENVGKEQLFTIKLKKKFQYQKMKIIENTLSDTCMIGIMKIPPGKTGLLYKIEFMSDSISYKYFPYKANKGNLTIDHIFLEE